MSDEPMTLAEAIELTSLPCGECGGRLMVQTGWGGDGSFTIICGCGAKIEGRDNDER